MQGIEAYRFLLETICGLKSEILGEGEIARQFKDAYRQFAGHSPCSQLLNVLEKLFQDGKRIRSENLTGISTPSYAGIVRKMIINRYPAGAVAILGSGNLAGRLIKILPTRYPVHLFARNHKNAQHFQELYKTQLLKWGDFARLAAVPVIVDVTSSKKAIFDQSFLQSWEENNRDFKLMIRLNPPLPISARERRNKNILELTDVFADGKKLKKQNQQKIVSAKAAIKERADYRFASFHPPASLNLQELQLT